MRILIIEDEQDFAEAIRQGLARSGYAVDVAHTGDDGLAMALGLPYDLILLDRMLPGQDGVSVCRALRDQGSATPVLMMTAMDAVDNRVEGLDAGADDYLVKPFELKELFARIRARLRATTASLSNTLVVHDLALNLETGQVFRSGQTIALSRKELTLLAHLMRYPGRIFTKDQLLDHVWDSDAEPESDVVRAQVKNIRKKIDDPFPKKLIQTVYGMGYKIEG